MGPLLANPRGGEQGLLLLRGLYRTGLAGHQGGSQSLDGHGRLAASVPSDVPQALENALSTFADWCRPSASVQNGVDRRVPPRF